jgi:4-hydroxybenzoate polyprenyltransferase
MALEPEKNRSTTDLPLVVDLDGTLLLTDTLDEQAAHALFHNPRRFVGALVALPQGRARTKAVLAPELDFGAAALPFRDDLLVWLRAEAARGRPIHLCSAANQTVVDAIARRIGIFESATGSADENLKGAVKAEFLKRAFPDGFSYVGDSTADLEVWKAADAVVLAGASADTARAARALGKPVEREFTNPGLSLRDTLKAFRVHHWSKNALIFVPLILGHAYADLRAVGVTLLGLACLLLVTSATYLINDVSDLDADRRHWSKRTRAIASGRLPIRHALAIAGVALVVAFAVAIALSHAFALALAGYLTLTLAYSLGLKRIPLLDTLVIGVLFTARLVMGMALLGHPFSEWLMTFSLFFFVSLAIAKRHTEIVRADTKGEQALARRGYRVEDNALTLAFGVATGVASLLIMVLYIVNDVLLKTAFSNPRLFWCVPIILAIWFGRIWLLAHRGEMNDDPVSFALRDRTSIGLGVAMALVVVVAL